MFIGYWLLIISPPFGGSYRGAFYFSPSGAIASQALAIGELATEELEGGRL